jgi:predicted RNase H-like HicB family nuclease
VTSIPLSIIYEPVENGWVQARIEELAPVITAAPTRDEARELVLDALREYLLSLRGNVAPGPGSERESVALTISA